MQQLLLAKFAGLLANDPDLLGSGVLPPDATVTVGKGKCLFTIAGLFNWVKAEGDLDYRQFRSALYSGTLHHELRQLGYTLEVNSATGKVDTSVYHLVKLGSLSEN